ncbi:Isoprenoid synthase domain containing protein [Tylopilus felleus]
MLCLSRSAFSSPRHERHQSASALETPQPASSFVRSYPFSSSGKVDPHTLLKTEITRVRSSLLNLLAARCPLSRPGVLDDFNPSMPDHIASFNAPFDLRPPPIIIYPSPPPSLCAQYAVSFPRLADVLLPTQLRLAHIVEMVHVASLLHDDVVDKSDLRRGAPSTPAALGNRLAILGGDPLLGRAKAVLSRLGDVEVWQMQGMGAQSNGDSPSASHAYPSDRRCTYLKKTYLKTASRAAEKARYKELVDDAMDFSSSTALGKPGSGADLRLRLTTAPLEPMIARGLKHDDDVERTLSLVHASSGVSRTLDFAEAYAKKAREYYRRVRQRRRWRH